MNVRRAVPQDAESLASTARRAITITAAHAYDDAQVNQWSGHFTDTLLADSIATTTVFVVEDGRTMCGFANLLVAPGGRAVLDHLYVDPDYVGRGLARLAVGAVETEATRRRVPRLWVDASLLAAPVLEHLGYVVEERYDKLVGALTYPNAWLSKPL